MSIVWRQLHGKVRMKGGGRHSNNIPMVGHLSQKDYLIYSMKYYRGMCNELFGMCNELFGIYGELFGMCNELFGMCNELFGSPASFTPSSTPSRLSSVLRNC